MTVARPPGRHRVRGRPGQHRLDVPPRRWPRRTIVGAAACAVLLTVSAGWQPAYSSFFKTTATGSNSWTTGTVTFGANNPASALFTVTGAEPGSFGSQCIQISYTGSLTAGVRLYASASGTLAPYLTLQITEDNDTSHTCGTFSSTATIYNTTGMTDTTKTLTAFATASSNWSTGVSSWSASPSSTTRLYTIAWQLQDDNGAVSKTASATFTWAAQT
jgi:hypothetical protein